MLLGLIEFTAGMAKKCTFHQKSAVNGKVRLKRLMSGQNHNFQKKLDKTIIQKKVFKFFKNCPSASECL